MNRWIVGVVALGALLAGLSFRTGGGAGAVPSRQEASPTPYSCASPLAATPMSGMDGMAMATPMSEMVEFDQIYIDMMIPHHAALTAMSQAALGLLTDDRLIAIAERMIAVQTAEIDELRGYREQFYGSADPMPMDQSMMEMMGQMMPGMATSMAEMARQMDPAAMVAAICTAPDPDIAFIDLTVPHHRNAIAASEAALEQATHQEIKDFAQGVIEDQQAEIEELEAIRQDLGGDAAAGSPAAG